MMKPHYIDVACCYFRGLISPFWPPAAGEAAAAQLEADAQALADVRTLDEWADRTGKTYSLSKASVWRVIEEDEESPTNDPGFTRGEGATPDEARAKAAAWVREHAEP